MFSPFFAHFVVDLATVSWFHQWVERQDQSHVDCSVVFICRDDEEIGVFYLNVFIIEFTTVKFKIRIKIKINFIHDAVVGNQGVEMHL